MSCHQLRMVCTAKAAVSLPIPTFTQPVGGKIINSMGHGAAEFVDQEVARMNLFRVALRAPFAVGVLDVAREFLLLRVDGDQFFGQGPDRLIDETELSVAVWIIGAFLGLAIGLQAELLRLQQFANDRMADLVPEFV